MSKDLALEEVHVYRTFVKDYISCTYIGDYDPQLLLEYYDSIEEMPTWAQHKLSVLHMIPLEYPTPIVTGVGRKIDNEKYWLYVTERET